MSRILITSALPYINGVKHLGTLTGSQLPADVFARFQRQRLGKDNVLFICATDDHGAPAELAAIEEGLAVEAYCTKWYEVQKKLGAGFHLSFDHFGRSSNKPNHELTTEFARALWRNGFLDVRTTRQVYSKADGRFLQDRFVVGTCPHCGYEQARGDQCENCTRVLDPTDLINPRSALSGSPDIEVRETKHLFLKQAEFSDRLREWINSKKDVWPHLVSSIALKWLDEGLRDRGITRDLKWGVPVPHDIADGELKGKVFYVWFDAPIEYIGATREWADAIGQPDAWRRWWFGKEAQDVRYFEFMGKDNVPFHTVGFPVTLMGANQGQPADKQWKLVDHIKGFNWLNYYGGKFSTSQKRGVFMDTALQTLPADYWRWYLIANSPESADVSFTWQHFGQTVNDLPNLFGNFVNRILTFTSRNLGDAVPAEGQEGEAEKALFTRYEESLEQLTTNLEEMQFRRAAAELRGLWALGNQYLVDAAPWTHIKTNRAAAAASVRTAINLARVFAVISKPFVPEAASRLLTALGQSADQDSWPTGKAPNDLSVLKPGHRFTVPDILFRKLADEDLKAWESQFAGT
jgi:methionyl-tRNA synthetase